jgi:hypothetical protein
VKLTDDPQVVLIEKILARIDDRVAEAVAKERKEIAAMLEVNDNPLGKLLAAAVRARSKT